MPAIIVNWLLEEYRKFLAQKEEKPMIAMLGKGSKGKKPPKLDVNCNYWNKKGHKEDQCWIKHPGLKPEKRKKDKSEKAKYSMMATVTGPKCQSDCNVWYPDSGA